MEQTFRYAFYLMTALSIIGMALASLLRDKVLEAEQERQREARGGPINSQTSEGQAAS
jgi:heme exporter protein D